MTSGEQDAPCNLCGHPKHVGDCNELVTIVEGEAIWDEICHCKAKQRLENEEANPDG